MSQIYALRSLTGNFLDIASSAAFAFGGIWTIEFWYRQVNGGAGSGYVLSNAAYTSNYHHLQFDVPGQIRLTSGIGYTVMSTMFASNTNTTWTHYAFVSNGTCHTFKNGILVDNNNFIPVPYGDFNVISPMTFFLNCEAYFRHFRISNTARYSANFTVSSHPLIVDGNTVCLVNGNTNTFSEGTGKTIVTNTTSQVLVDATGFPAIDTVLLTVPGNKILIDNTSNKIITLN